MAGAWRLFDVGARPGCLAAKKRSGAVAQPVLPKEAPDKVRLDVHEDVQPRGFDILCNRTHERNARDASTQPGRAHQPGQRHVKNNGSDRKLAGDTGDRDDQSETVGQRGTVHSRRQLDVVAISSRVRRRPSWLDRDAMVIRVLSFRALQLRMFRYYTHKVSIIIYYDSKHRAPSTNRVLASPDRYALTSCTSY